MRKIKNICRKICALLLAFTMVAGLLPATIMEKMGVPVIAMAQTTGAYELNNGYIQVTVSEKTGGFGIRTLEGDQVNKSDNDQYLVFEYDEDNTSFTSFQVTRNGETKEYVFGGKYEGSSPVSVRKVEEELLATWSVDDLTFTQTISLINTGSNEHGTALISYEVKNTGEPAQVRLRMLVDTALGYQDYAYYRVGDTYLERETALAEDGYNKSFYAVTNPDNPRIVAYTINASIGDQECKPYQTIFGHWNNLASTVFDYTPDEDMTFTNFNNRKYQTSDSAYALYFDLGQVAEGATALAATNYGVYSNESVKTEATIAVNVNAPDVLEFGTDGAGREDQSTYANGGQFSVKTYIQNISDQDYEKIRIVVNCAGSMIPLDQEGNPTDSSYDNPYSMEILDVTAGEQLDIDWNFIAEPQEMGVYGKVQYRVYDVSDEATLGTGRVMQENLLGEGYSFILCPGSVEKIPALRFTGSTPDTIFSSGMRSLYVTGYNFGMLLDKASYNLVLSRVDGNKMGQETQIVIPTEQFQIDDAANVMTVYFTDDAPGALQDGMYQLTIDYTDASKEDISGQALRFYVSSKEEYKNESYGYLAVIKSQGDSGNLMYSVQHFASEEDYWEEISSMRLNREEVLLEFAGNFICEENEDGSDVYTGVSMDGGNNVMTMNGCLDIKNGSATVTVKDGSVLVDFDADLYTTGSGTFVWSGMCALTELEAGEEYNLIPYTENGEREFMTGESIALIWPSVGKEFRSLMGLLFDFRYGELGTIAHEGAPTAQASETRVLAFGAAMDLSFLIPESISKTLVLGGRTAATKDILGDSWDAAEHNKIQFTPQECRALMKQADLRKTAAATNATMDDVNNGTFSDFTVDDTPGYNAASIAIDDILFGGEYLGVNMDLALGIPPYIQGLPALEGLLSIHTVGDWYFSVDGQCHFASFTMKAGISIISKDDIPVVDSLNFFIGGITPGFNIDGVGVLWLQGAGGGIENLYDTIFLTDAVPPLKLIIQAQFSVMQVFSAVATMGISMRGVDLTLTNGQFREHVDENSGVVTVPQPITMNGGIRLDWYPEFYFHGYVNLMLAMIVNGGGYVVADADGFYEFFLRAGIQVPSDIPIIGGYSVADMNLGVNPEKLFGKMSLLDELSLSMTYYWGGDFDWNSGAEVYPTYPELVGMDTNGAMMTFAVDENEETGQTLYMALGTNARMSASSRSFGLTRNTSVIDDEITSDAVNGSSHQMKLTKNGSGKILSIQWPAESAQEAQSDLAEVIIADSTDSAKKIPLTIWKSGTNEACNALFNYVEDTKTAYLTVVFGENTYEKTEIDVYSTTWNISTPEASLLVVYDVAPLPEITVESAAVNERNITVELGADQRAQESFTKLTVFAEGQRFGQSYLLGGATDPFAEGETTLQLTMPEQAISDTYTLRVIARDNDGNYYSEAHRDIQFVNRAQPEVPVNVSAENAGDYKVAVTAHATGDFDGYQFTALDVEGNPVPGMSEILFHKDGSAVLYDENGYLLEAESNEVADSYLIGGHFEQTVEDEDGVESTMVTGFSAGTYTIQVRTWKSVAHGAAVLVSEPKEITITVREPIDTVIAAAAFPLGGSSLDQIIVTGDGRSSYQQTAMSYSDVIVQLTSRTETFTGTWRLDGGYGEDAMGEISTATKQANIPLTGLSDGTHQLTFRGVNTYGDAVEATCRFTVDTQGPRLLLEAPVNGSLFDYWTGEVLISGLTDAGTTMTVTDETTGMVILSEEALAVGTNGRFEQKVVVDRSIMSHDLRISLKDALGNVSEKTVNVNSNGLGSIETLLLYSGNRNVTNTKLTAGGIYPLSLWAKLARPATADATTDDLYMQINKDGMVDWALAVEAGHAEFTDTADGVLLTTSSDGEGMVTARFLVSDAGSYPVSAAFGNTGEQIQNLDDAYLQVITTDQFYTGTARTTDVEVWHRGVKLTEGTDYQLGAYANNVEVSTESTPATIQITGIGSYAGTVTGEFAISYLPLDESWIGVSGQMGENNYYVSDVTILAADGYRIEKNGVGGVITISEDGTHTESFRIRRESDGALTDLTERVIAIDKTVPVGSISMEQTIWNRFLNVITFGLYHVSNLAATVNAEDANGIAKVEVVVSETAYTSIAELEAADISWSEYSAQAKPRVNENTNQVIYARITDMAGNITYLSSDGLHVDTLAPTAGVVVKMSVTESEITFAVTSNEVGTYYYAVLEAIAEAPDAQALKSQNLVCAGKGSGNVNTSQVGTEITHTVSGLEANTAYVVYVVAEDALFTLDGADAAPNLSEVAASDIVRTAKFSLTNENTVITVENALYTGEERMPEVTVTHGGRVLVKDQDYSVTYQNHVEVSADQPYVQITGMGEYAGILTKGFVISYLEIEDENTYSVNGNQGENGIYISPVTLQTAEEYELVAIGESVLSFTEDGSYETFFRIRRLEDGAMTDVISENIRVDQTSPGVSVTVEDKTWREFLNTITFDLFFKETKEVVIAASDGETGSGLKMIGYLAANEAMDLTALENAAWTELNQGTRTAAPVSYTGSVMLDVDGNHVIYVKAVDLAGHTIYASSNGFVIDTTVPGVEGITDGGIYYGPVSFVVTDVNMESVTVNGSAVVGAATGETITLQPALEPQTIVITDKVGHSLTLTVTVIEESTEESTEEPTEEPTEESPEESIGVPTGDNSHPGLYLFLMLLAVFGMIMTIICMKQSVHRSSSGQRERSSRRK